jgi:20S proteasome alpha/beta subunit
MDPSGTFLQYDAKAIGSGSEGAQQSLQEVYHKVSSMAFVLLLHSIILLSGALS